MSNLKLGEIVSGRRVNGVFFTPQTVRAPVPVGHLSGDWCVADRTVLIHALGTLWSDV